VCYLYVHDPAYRQLYDGPTNDGSRLDRLAEPCLYRGGPTGQTASCTSCTNFSVAVLGCSRHGRCTTYYPTSGIPVCRSCPDRQAPGSLISPSIRNLIYHIYPRRDSDSWRWNITQLLQRIDLFNGRRIVAIVTDSYTDNPDTVKAALGDRVDDVVVMPNIPELREVNTFEALMSRVKSVHPSHVTFYAHAKGVGRINHPTVRHWTSLMYVALLDYWPLVRTTLLNKPLAGVFKKLGRGWPEHESKSEWHYSGSFLWFRNRDVFLKPDWARIDRFWSGIEPWPSLHFSADQAVSLFLESAVTEMNLYSADYFERTVVPAWSR
jgi:hypothetical protein